MESSYSYYYSLIPPSWFAREFDSVVVCFLFFTLGLGVYADLSLAESVFWKDTILDTLVIDALVATVCFCILFGVSASRLARYRTHARDVPIRVYALTAPWLIGMGLCLTLLFVSVMNSNGQHYSFVKILGAEVAPLALYEVPFIKRWIERMVTERYWKVFRRALPVMLGPRLGEDLDTHATAVLEFQNEYLPSARSGKPDDHLAYTDAQSLAVFQQTLSCLYETAWHVGKSVSRVVGNRSWSMADIGGGEGIFTCELFREAVTLPRSLYVVEPALENMEAYRARITNRYPSIDVVEPCVRMVEDVLETLPVCDLYLASHSLYKICDHRDPTLTLRVINKLAEKSSSGLCVIILASKSSRAYDVKRMVRGTVLKRSDPSSFGEDLLDLIANDHHPKREVRDSFIDLSGPLADPEVMLQWLSYFCRLGVQDLRPHMSDLKRILADHSIKKGELPNSSQAWIETVSRRAGLAINDATPILYHKEVVITLSSINSGACLVENL